MTTAWKANKVLKTHDKENTLSFYVFLMLPRFSLIMAGHWFRKGSNSQQNVPGEIQVSCNRVYLGLTCGCNLQLSHRHDCRTYVLGEFQLDCNKRTRWVHSTWQQREKRTSVKNTWQWNTLNFYVFFLMLLRFSLIMGHLFRKGSNLQQNVPDEIQVSCNRVLGWHVGATYSFPTIMMVRVSAKVLQWSSGCFAHLNFHSFLGICGF